MFENIEVLNKNKHQDLKFSPTKSYEFAGQMSLVPLSFSEMSQACKFYPIIFPDNGSHLPHVLLSMKKGENAYVDQDGKWLAPYIPAHIRRYPFILAGTGEEGNFALCFDTDAPNFNTEFGDPLYTANGDPTEVLNEAMEFLKRYQSEIAETEKVFAALDEKGVLAEKRFTLGPSEQQVQFGGFRAVDTEKLKELDNETLGDWVKKGIMGLVYAHLHSLDNIRNLVG